MKSCRYELYCCIRPYQQCLFIAESEVLELLKRNIEHQVKRDDCCYIILDNQTEYPVDYTLLGFHDMPSDEALYDIVSECKHAKTRDRIPVGIEDDDILWEWVHRVVEQGEKETEQYFNRLNELKRLSLQS